MIEESSLDSTDENVDNIFLAEEGVINVEYGWAVRWATWKNVKAVGVTLAVVDDTTDGEYIVLTWVGIESSP